ncbi:MAG: hypothetical protein JSU92_14210 [Deltaproteobacteria bacterium]|nr:MAG: hypothetical protein JSU92_14210 [Deltaproteobacteria bacterium]
MFQKYFDRIVEFATGDDLPEVEKAKKDYFKLTGEVNEEDKSFEIRLAGFLDWYIFDRPLDGIRKTPAQAFYDSLDSSSPENEREIYEGFLSTIHSIFQIEKFIASGVHIRDLFTKKRYFVEERRSIGFSESDIMEARLVFLNGGYYFTEALYAYPREAWKFIKGEIKKYRREGKSVSGLIPRLSQANLKFERYHGIDIKEIFK